MMPGDGTHDLRLLSSRPFEHLDSNLGVKLAAVLPTSPVTILRTYRELRRHFRTSLSTFVRPNCVSHSCPDGERHHDVSGNGESSKTYGRIFYTRGKRLVFYAYDLDAQHGIQETSTFQAWGRKGPDKKQALNLGVLYEDNASKERWVLRADNPKSLEDIDTVFVTIEPNGGSQHPSGKQLLFAYLCINPNYP